MTRFSGQTAISSKQYFGEKEDEPTGGNYGESK